MYHEIEDFTCTDITNIMQKSYIDYSMSVIISRALPDVRDGLKPVQRRILYAMFCEGLLHCAPFDKCAGVVGEVLKNYHPHGDTSVYDTLVRMAQKWIMRYPLIESQGNFGSIDGDPPAAYRYTECRLTGLAEEMLSNIDHETIDFKPNYKESSVEPLILPAKIPNLLMNGSTGIAVGMTTNIPPHNFNELSYAICKLIDNPNITISEIIKYLPGPDFPTGGSIFGTESIIQYMKTGRGILRIKGKTSIEETVNGREQIIITEIPYNVNRSSLVSKIADLINHKILFEVNDLRDESDYETRIVIELKRGETAKIVLNKLHKHTQLESSFGVIMLALDDNKPKTMNIKEILECYIKHRCSIIFRYTMFLLRKARDRANVLRGYIIALDEMGDFVRIISLSSNRISARFQLIDKYSISNRQTDAILDLRLYQLTNLEKDKIFEERNKVLGHIIDYRNIISSEIQLLSIIKNEICSISKKYLSPRRTALISKNDSFCIEDIIANEGCIISVTHKGFIKRTCVNYYKSQKRGGKGVIGAGQHNEDFIEHLFTASAHNYIMFFTRTGRVYVKKVYEIPEGLRISKGRSIVNILQMSKDEKITAMICVKQFNHNQYLIMGTARGLIKKTNLKSYSNYRRGGVIGIKINKDDQLIGVKLVKQKDEIIIITHQGMSIRFSEISLRDQGRATCGVKGISLKKTNKGQDEVEVVEVCDPKATLLIAGSNGFGKRTGFDEYRLQVRGGYGVIAIRNDSNVAGALSVFSDDEIMMLTESGQAVRSPVAGIRVIGRATQGVKLIDLAREDRLIGVCRIVDPLVRKI